MATKKAPASGINKMDAVRQAMGELGNAAARTEIQKFVKERFGIELNLDTVSSYKAFIASKAKKSAATTQAAKPVAQQPASVKKKGQKQKRRGKAASRPLVAVSTAPREKANGIALSDIQTVKALVGRVGADSLKTLIDVFSK